MLVSAALRELEAAYRIAECGFALTAQFEEWAAKKPQPNPAVPAN